MNQLKELPDLSRSFLKLKLQEKLDLVSDQTIFGHCIRYARLTKQPLHQIAETILSQYQDAPHVVLDVVPQETIDLIKKIYPQ
jgi:hypothetical protein